MGRRKVTYASQGISDLILEDWRDYPEIITDSLWVMDRDQNYNNAKHHGNFIPQIPYQLIKRYTKKGDLVIDPFLGSGTSGMVAKELGRDFIGLELNKQTLKKARRAIREHPSEYETLVRTANGDSASVEMHEYVINVLQQNKTREYLDLVILHPPYHDIILYNNDYRCLSAQRSIKDFLDKFGEIVEIYADFLKEKHYLGLVIGDKYADGQLIPLSYYCMAEILSRPARLKLKSIVVKNMDNTTAKRNQDSLWHYRALHGGFYVFKHEYVMLFQKENNNRVYNR